eukprot:GFUD01045031.1.p1 GENE.GFUD01045031.1~~GFUD01045031.1.p1  ORF type:complete len:125 (-),score=12.77 GFUD01045031.1:84-458(-)
MSNNFTSQIANVYFTRISNISKFQSIPRKTIASNKFKETLMSKHLKSETKVNLLKKGFFCHKRLFSTNSTLGFHQRNPPGQSRPNRNHLLPAEPFYHGDDHFVAGTCYATIVFVFLFMNVVTFI